MTENPYESPTSQDDSQAQDVSGSAPDRFTLVKEIGGGAVNGFILVYFADDYVKMAVATKVGLFLMIAIISVVVARVWRAKRRPGKQRNG